MGPVKEILAETQLQEELTKTDEAKLIVVDFMAQWCGPCQTIAPFYEQLSRKYPNAVFLKVDVDKCQETAVNQRVSVMPTFHFYRNKVKVDSMQGADPQKLEEKIQKYYDDGTADNDVGVAGHMNKEKKKSQMKYKLDKGQNKSEPQPEMSRMVSTHNMGENDKRRRSSFKDVTKKMFGRNSHSSGSHEQRMSQSSHGTRRSFKELVHDLFHPHQNEQNDPKPKETKSSKEKRKKPSATQQ